MMATRTSTLVVVMLGALAGCPSSGGAPTPTPPAPAPDEPAPVPVVGEVERSGDELVLPGPLAFADDGTDLGADSEPALDALRAFLEAHPDVTLLRIEGHVGAGVADDPADPSAAIMFSGERAFTVGVWLAQHGIDCTRLLAAGFGDSKPVADDRTPEGHAANSRITIKVATLRGIAIGGMPTDGGAPASTDVCEQ